jgi:hypothetical protein
MKRIKNYSYLIILILVFALITACGGGGGGVGNIQPQTETGKNTINASDGEQLHIIVKLS